MGEIQVTYDDATVRRFIWCALIWGCLGLMAGLWVAGELFWPSWNVAAQLSYGRLRPLHTQIALFGFLGNLIFAAIYHSTQRLCAARMASDNLSAWHLWGWQVVLLGPLLTLPFGMTQGRTYAEPEWPIDVAFFLVWLAFSINLFRTIRGRNTLKMYVSLWFYMATSIMIGFAHVVGNLVYPLSLNESYSFFFGMQDALVQEWFRAALVSFWLMAPLIGAMYYYLPKISGRPVYSYRLTIVHFWAFIFISPWVGPNALLNTSLPDWAQSMGMLFSWMLWAPAFAAVLNGMMTLRGAWARLQTEPALRFFVAALVFYGLAVTEAPWLATRSASSLTLFTDWRSGQVHTLVMGWDGLMVAGLLYWLVPSLCAQPLYSVKSAKLHFWTAIASVSLYWVATRAGALTQATMWSATRPDGTLVYPVFGDVLRVLRPWYALRWFASGLYLVGYGSLCWNLWWTWRRSAAPATTQVRIEQAPRIPDWTWRQLILGRPVVTSVLVVSLVVGYFVADRNVAVLIASTLFFISVLAWVYSAVALRRGTRHFHAHLEQKPLVFATLIVASISVGSIVELTPMMWDRGDATQVRTSPEQETSELAMAAAADPAEGLYRPLELQGRAIYQREGCAYCHSQQVRPLAFEVTRYGPVSHMEEYRFDHPYLGGSARKGPDLHRLGDRSSPIELFQTLVWGHGPVGNAGSFMPSYPWLAEERADLRRISVSMRKLQALGVPYTDVDIAGAFDEAARHAQGIGEALETGGIEGVHWQVEAIALIAYLQRSATEPGPAPAYTHVQPARNPEEMP